MKRFYSLLIVLLTLCSVTYAQTPPPSGLSGASLRQWYKQNYYDGKHQTLGYSAARQKMYNFIDNKNNTITCVYSGYQLSWTYGGSGTNPAPINCEHTVPQSFFEQAEPMRSDIHHLFPTYASWNSTRSNHPFAEITDSQTEKWMLNTSSSTSIPSTNINAYSEYAAQKFEPREDHKGNLARAVFYFYTMYPTQAGAMNRVADINVLYQWHLQDPVDNAERQRNALVEQYQGNRNPYIDYPETVGIAWGLSGGATGGGTGGGSTPTGSDLFISEYIEGSSYNKAIEIYNPTSASISLTNYSLRTQVNGSGSWTNTLTLSGTLAAGQTYLIVNASASTTLKNKANLVTTSSALNFNGNDPVALFKGSSVLDAVGTYNSTITFGADKTLVRKSSVTSPSGSYTATQWTAYASDTFTYAGSHTMSGGGSTGGGSTAAPTGYCASKGNSVVDEWINRVVFGSINNTSGSNGGYKDYTNLSTSLSKGSSQTITIYPAWSGTNYSEAYNVWIDWNRDGDFNDSGELVFSQSRTTALSVSGSITVPTTASTGTTRMRVTMKYNANASACETFSYGEVEDYHLTILGTFKIANPNANTSDNLNKETATSLHVYPNPSTSQTFLTISTPNPQNIQVIVYDMQGKAVITQHVFVENNHLIELSTQQLQTGMYIIRVLGADFEQTSKLIKE